jgi:hypothetical protein
VEERPTIPTESDQGLGWSRPITLLRSAANCVMSSQPETYTLDGHQYILAAAGDTLCSFTLY